MAQGYFESEKTVQFFQNRNDEININKKTYNIPVAQKFFQAKNETIKKINKNFHFTKFCGSLPSKAAIMFWAAKIAILERVSSVAEAV